MRKQRGIGRNLAIRLGAGAHRDRRTKRARDRQRQEIEAEIMQCRQDCRCGAYYSGEEFLDALRDPAKRRTCRCDA